MSSCLSVRLSVRVSYYKDSYQSREKEFSATPIFTHYIGWVQGRGFKPVKSIDVGMRGVYFLLFKPAHVSIGSIRSNIKVEGALHPTTMTVTAENSL